MVSLRQSLLAISCFAITTSGMSSIAAAPSKKTSLTPQQKAAAARKRDLYSRNVRAVRIVKSPTGPIAVEIPVYSKNATAQEIGNDQLARAARAYAESLAAFADLDKTMNGGIVYPPGERTGRSNANDRFRRAIDDRCYDITLNDKQCEVRSVALAKQWLQEYDQCVQVHSLGQWQTCIAGTNETMAKAAQADPIPPSCVDSKGRWLPKERSPC